MPAGVDDRRVFEVVAGVSDVEMSVIVVGVDVRVVDFVVVVALLPDVAIAAVALELLLVVESGILEVTNAILDEGLGVTVVGTLVTDVVDINAVDEEVEGDCVDALVVTIRLKN